MNRYHDFSGSSYIHYPYPNLDPKGNTFFQKVYDLKFLQPETTNHFLAVIAGRGQNGAGSRDILWKG